MANISGNCNRDEKDKLLKFHPIIGSIQKIALYQTKARLYIIGSNYMQTRFRILNIDRTEPKELVIVDDKYEYNQKEIHEIVSRIENGIIKTKSAFGIIGFVRFLEGYYIILVTKRIKIAVIGYHSIYKVEQSTLMYIPNDDTRPKHPDEVHYYKSFEAFDLSTNFYFSYDLTHSLQINLAPPRVYSQNMCPRIPNIYSDFDEETAIGEECTEQRFNDDDDLYETWRSQLNHRNVSSKTSSTMEFGVRVIPEWRFVWNTHLLAPVHSHLHPDWILYLTHGFVGQSCMSIFGRSLYITVIARRSNRYAGTRFLKRGANSYGDVANEVESEQIVHDSMVSSLNTGRFSSFVQLRGSVPGNWSQDISKIVSKAPISLNLSDPYFCVAAKHFHQLLERYGSPVVVLNLVKKREKKKHESFLSEELSSCVKYLNQFLPPDHLIQYFHIDMARMNKESTVFDKLTEIAHMGIKKTGIFVSCKPLGECYGVPGHQAGILQTGVMRVNCVDCLDRTNTAQFAIGKCALGYQLCALGFLNSPILEFDTDCVRLLECLYEDHGDTLALQYGGSQLVHRIKTYRKTAPWRSQGNDIMQTLSRYFSNKFSDAEKQNSINLFLGLFVPDIDKPSLWDATNDYYLHHLDTVRYKKLNSDRSPLTMWWSRRVIDSLPISHAEMKKKFYEIVELESLNELSQLEMVNAYRDYHRPYEITDISGCYSFKLFENSQTFNRSYPTDASPFVVRGRPYGEVEGAPMSNNPGLSGGASTSSNNSSDSNSESSSDDEISSSNPSTGQVSPSPNKEKNVNANGSDRDRSFASFPIVTRSERITPREPGAADSHLYKRYAAMTKKASRVGRRSGTVEITVGSGFSIDSTLRVIPPTVKKIHRETYARYVAGYAGPRDPSAESSLAYKSYASSLA